MEYKRLVVDNFRCFEHFEIDFARDVSIIIGKNGAGKTSLIKSIVYSLYFMFTSDRSSGNDFLAAGNPDLTMKSPDFSEFYRNSTADKIGDVNLHGELELNGEILNWDMFRRSTPNSSLYPSKYKTAYQQFMALYRNNGQLPLVAYFSDSFPHRQTNISSFAKEEMRKGEQTLRNFGYYQWDNETACTTIWEQRLTNALIKDKMLDETNEFNHTEVKYVVNKLREFSRPIHADCDDSFEISRVFVSFNENEERELWLRLKEGKEVRFGALPAGYRRLYSMVLDLSYRTFLLNRSDSIMSCGLVLIDEIDLHLHPSLAIEVVERFTRLFPHVQYVMTSHSPLVVTNLPHKDGDNKILRLVSGEQEPHVLPDVYGIDYDAAIRDIMEVNDNNAINFLRSSILRAMRNGDNQLLEMRKKELRRYVSNIRYEQIVTEMEQSLR
ncbi:MAG: AAA family ATPase [Prevotellaceae bacterium]|jgi:predicted ATP-binding protein involved in virulence|nr:AAA family ATPase [Prevotellaceae bacterium]